jgi:branched-chain amino acid transport system permease protein
MREAGEFRTLGLGLIITLSILLMPKGLVGRISDLVRWLRHRNGATPRTKLQEKPAAAGE